MTSDPILRLDAGGTAIFVLAAFVGVVASAPAPTGSAVASLVLFATGCVAFLAGFLAGVNRSRNEQVELAGLFFLARSAPRPVARRFRLLLGVQIAVAVAAASARPFSESAFGVLAPMFGLGLMALWGGRHGDFGPKSAHRGD